MSFATKSKLHRHEESKSHKKNARQNEKKGKRICDENIDGNDLNVGKNKLPLITEVIGKDVVMTFKRYPLNKVTGSLSVGVPKDLANHWTDMVLLKAVYHRSWKGL